MQFTQDDDSGLTGLAAWEALSEHHTLMAATHMRRLFAEDPQRFKTFSLKVGDILLDYSKNRVTTDTLTLLMDLARECGLADRIKALFKGKPVNSTEHRPALHTALRDRTMDELLVDGEDIIAQIRHVRVRMRAFVDAVHSGQWLGYSGQPITDVVNIGIGGSDLGPQMVCEALMPYRQVRGVNVHFMSNVDAGHVYDILHQLRPETTLFIIASKSFTTQECLTNAQTAMEWWSHLSNNDTDMAQHFVAVTAHPERAEQIGIASANIFEFWDWVGGRYSLWSAVGLSIALYLGMDNYEALLDGAYEMDQHFREAPLEANMPVIMAMLGVWYNNFFGAESHAILPYDQHLHRFPAYFQQGDMESNGKHVTLDGHKVDYDTGAIIWGETGTNGQHAYFQLLHQGTRLIPADFIAPVKPYRQVGRHQTILLANFIAQTRALMLGKSRSEVETELKAQGLAATQIAELAPHKELAGNRPTNTLLLGKLSPNNLGALIALYEHKIFVQSVIWNINPFDQWGVEYGKAMTQEALKALSGSGDLPADWDASSRSLLQYCRDY